MGRRERHVVGELDILRLHHSTNLAVMSPCLGCTLTVAVCHRTAFSATLHPLLLRASRENVAVAIGIEADSVQPSI